MSLAQSLYVPFALFVIASGPGCDAGAATPIAEPEVDVSEVDAAEAPLEVDAAEAPLEVDAGEKPTVDEATDPLVLAIDGATSVLSEAGCMVHDYEWDWIQYAISQSRLSRDRLREVLDTLFAVAPYPTSYPMLRLPAEQQLVGTFRVDQPLTDKEEIFTRTHRAEAVPIYELPWEIRARVVTLLDLQGRTPIMHLQAEVRRRDSDNAPMVAEVVIATSDCGWCMEGYRYFIAADGTVLETWSEQAWSASGYCC